ncbi:MAG TPA: BglII/BstYI family type II restriction endonuclease [Candidatus Limnocylindrales bacterium]|nr:BglII/BstYI family type II restriction endonuclease [Candidatus Limnocylindrales bacterium]
MRIAEYSIHRSKEYLVTRPEIHASLLAAVVNAQEAQIRAPKTSIVKHLCREFKSEGWQADFQFEQGKLHTQYFDFFRNRVAVGIEFSRYEFIYQDFIRFLAAYNANKIDVGVIITNTREGLERIKYKSSGSNYERVLEELDWLCPTLTVPLWIIGLK